MIIKKSFFIFSLFLLFNCDKKINLNDSTIKWMQDYSVTIPKNAKVVDYCFSLEFGKIIELKIDKPELINFIDEYKLIKTNSSPEEFLILYPDLDNTKNIDKKKPDLYYLKGVKDTVVFSVIADLNNNRLWLQVFHDDAGGDSASGE